MSELFDPDTGNFLMRDPCKACGEEKGRIEQRSGQDCVFCSQCGKFAYNAPRVETGRKQRSVSTVHEGIRPSVRYLVLERARGRCELCGITDTILHVSHLLSVKDGLKEGFTEAQLNREANLAAFCENCNLGQGEASVEPILWLALMRRRLAR